MGRRIEVELTSTRDDGSWTWRAAGAKQPRGDLRGDLLYGGAKVGDVVKVEADFHLDGIEIVEVFPPKAKKERSDLLELKSRPLRDDELVTTQRVARRDRGDRDRGRRGDRPGRGDRRDRRGASNRREARPDRPQRPKPKRLRPKRDHRNALLASVAEEHRPIVEQVVRDGMPGVRAAIDKQNAEAKEAGKPEIDAAPILAIAERNLAAARLAEWRDRADAALASIDDLDLRDLRSVVVVGNDVARDDESRALAEKLKSSLDERMEKDHGQWLSDLRAAVSDGRVVRALRLSSRPVKAGAPLPTELAGELSRQAAAALAPDVEPSRWAIVLDALAFSPVRGAVTPVGVPAEPGEELLDEVRRLSDRIPAIAGLFGIDPAQVPRRAKRRRPPRGGGKGSERKPKAKRGDRAAEKAKSPAEAKPAEKSKPESKATQPAEAAPVESEEAPKAAPVESEAPVEASPVESGGSAEAPKAPPAESAEVAEAAPVESEEAPGPAPVESEAPVEAAPVESEEAPEAATVESEGSAEADPEASSTEDGPASPSEEAAAVETSEQPPADAGAAIETEDPADAEAKDDSEEE